MRCHSRDYHFPGYWEFYSWQTCNTMLDGTPMSVSMIPDAVIEHLRSMRLKWAFPSRRLSPWHLKLTAIQVPREWWSDNGDLTRTSRTGKLLFFLVLICVILNFKACAVSTGGAEVYENIEMTVGRDDSIATQHTCHWTALCSFRILTQAQLLMNDVPISSLVPRFLTTSNWLPTWSSPVLKNTTMTLPICPAWFFATLNLGLLVSLVWSYQNEEKYDQ